MSQALALPQTGGCLCGAVRYALTGPPLLAYACHCHDCQKRSGSAFSLTLVIHRSELAVTGTPRVFTRRTRSGRVIEQAACGACRADVFAHAPAAPDYASLLAGTLDDASWVRPIAQTFVGSAIPWAVIPDVDQVDWADFDYEEQGRRWRANAPNFG